MALKLGVNSINKLYLGSTAINKAYLGATVLFSGGGAVPFSPASLFTSNDQGFVVDAYATSSLWQDDAGTIPATAHDDPVALWKDNSGSTNGVDHSTAVLADRPKLQIVGNRRTILSDGISDKLTSVTRDFTGKDVFTACFAIRSLDTNGNSNPVWAAHSLNDGLRMIYAPRTSSLPVRFQTDNNGTDVLDAPSPTYDPPLDMVIIVEGDIPSGTLKLWIDGTLVASETGVSFVDDWQTGVSRLFGDEVFGDFAKVEIARGMEISRGLTASEFTDLLNWGQEGLDGNVETVQDWAQTAPSLNAGEYLFAIQATAASRESTDIINTAEFSAASVVGIGGSDGDPAISNAIVTLYRLQSQNTTPPAKPTGTFTFNFATQALTGGTLNGWLKTMPNVPSGQFIWVTQAAASNFGAIDQIPATEFSTPVVFSGVGTSGINGLNTAIVFLYRKGQTDTAPTKPTGSFLYTFSTGVLSLTSGSFNSWTQAPPSLLKGERLFQIQAVASNTAANDAISADEFSTPIINTRAGEDGPVGARGPGRWNIPVTSLPTSAYTAHTRWNSDPDTPITPISSDQAWFYTGAQASPTSQSVWIYTGSTWAKQDEVIDGNLLVSGTLTADKISIGDGSLSSDGSGNLIVKGGNITQLEDNYYTANLPKSGLNFLQLVGGARLDIPPAYNADIQIAVSFEHFYSSINADNPAWGCEIEAGSPYVLMNVDCGFMHSLSSYTILDLGNAGQANWNALDGTTGQTKSVGSTISTTDIIDRPVTSVISGVTYVIKSLGSTSQATWNNMAGTLGLLYEPGDLFSATTAGTGTGTVDIYQGDGKVRGTGYHVIHQRLQPLLERETDYVTIVSVIKDLENIGDFNGNPAEAPFFVFVYWIGESYDTKLLDCISSIFVRFK